MWPNGWARGAVTSSMPPDHRPGGVPLSVLDTSPIVSGSTAREALGNSLDLARCAERLGYHRYWVAEHHGMRGVAAAATAVVVGRIADATARIRVGSGAVLLPNHAPMVVAEQFGTLEAFHPGRIDLGVGRALGGSRRSADAVRSADERAALTFPEQLRELVDQFDPAADPAVRAVPAPGNRPSIWLLGSSDVSGELAGSTGLPYAFAHHLRPEGAPTALELYRNGFSPSPVCPEPTVLVSVALIAADSDERAQWLAGSTRLKVLGRHRGRRILLPSPQEAAAHLWTADDRAAVEGAAGRVLVGSPDTLVGLLQDVVDGTGADELAITTAVHGHEDRCRSYELVARIGRRLTSYREARSSAT